MGHMYNVYWRPKTKFPQLNFDLLYVKTKFPQPQQTKNQDLAVMR